MCVRTHEKMALLSARYVPGPKKIGCCRRRQISTTCDEILLFCGAQKRPTPRVGAFELGNVHPNPQSEGRAAPAAQTVLWREQNVNTTTRLVYECELMRHDAVGENRRRRVECTKRRGAWRPGTPRGLVASTASLGAEGQKSAFRLGYSCLENRISGRCYCFF